MQNEICFDCIVPAKTKLIKSIQKARPEVTLHLDSNKPGYLERANTFFFSA